MLRVSRKAALALEAVVDIACNSRPEPVQAKEITKRQGIPQRYLENVMQSLVHAGILKGVRGPKGGYRLARERRRITAGEIVRIVAAIEQAEEENLPGPSAIGAQVIQPVIEDLHQGFMQQLDGISVEDLCLRAEGAGLAEPAHARADFAI